MGRKEASRDRVGQVNMDRATKIVVRQFRTSLNMLNHFRLIWDGVGES